jgi:hypothetical protein
MLLTAVLQISINSINIMLHNSVKWHTDSHAALRNNIYLPNADVIRLSRGISTVTSLLNDYFGGSRQATPETFEFTLPCDHQNSTDCCFTSMTTLYLHADSPHVESDKSDY